jgi:hypothetical protein
MIRAACLYTLSVQHLTEKADNEEDKDFLAYILGKPVACDSSPPYSPATTSASGGSRPCGRAVYIEDVRRGLVFTDHHPQFAEYLGRMHSDLLDLLRSHMHKRQQQ